MPHIILDFDPPWPNAPEFTGETSDLVFFMSWGYSSRYGATHELSVLAQVLRRDFKLDLVPLLTFADRDTEDPADEEALELAWQDAAPLAECCEAAAATLGSGAERLTAIQDTYPNLRSHIAELGRIARWAAERGARLRITYLLDE